MKFLNPFGFDWSQKTPQKRIIGQVCTLKVFHSLLWSLSALYEIILRITSGFDKLM